MSRLSLLVGSAALAIGTIGCAHCDTCDDFPAPCTGPNCGFNGPYGPAAGPVMYPTGGSAPLSSPAGTPPSAGAAGAPVPPPELPAAPADATKPGGAATSTPPVPPPTLDGSTQP